MPWYKVTAMHGGGHQGNYLAYEYSSEVLSNGEREEVWLSHVNNLAHPVGKVRLCRRLPEKVRLEKISLYRSRISYFKDMLRILGAK